MKWNLRSKWGWLVLAAGTVCVGGWVLSQPAGGDDDGSLRATLPQALQARYEQARQAFVSEVRPSWDAMMDHLAQR